MYIDALEVCITDAAALHSRASLSRRVLVQGRRAAFSPMLRQTENKERQILSPA